MQHSLRYSFFILCCCLMCLKTREITSTYFQAFLERLLLEYEFIFQISRHSIPWKILSTSVRHSAQNYAVLFFLKFYTGSRTEYYHRKSENVRQKIELCPTYYVLVSIDLSSFGCSFYENFSRPFTYAIFNSNPYDWFSNKILYQYFVFFSFSSENIVYFFT